MGKTVEFRPHAESKFEVTIQPTLTNFVYADKLSIEGQAFLAKRMGGSFQRDPFFPDETSIYLAGDGVAIMFSQTGEFRILQKDKEEATFSQDRGDHDFLGEVHPHAVIALSSDGAVHIVWPESSATIEHGFAGVTITRGIGINTKSVEFHKLQDIETADNSIISQTASLVYEPMLVSAA